MVQTEPILPREITGALASVRRRLRAWSVVDGLAVAFLLVAALLWGTFFWDYSTEPGRPARLLAVVALGLALSVVIYWHFVRRLRAPLTDRSLALVLERHIPALEDRLVTAVELAERPGSCSESLLRKTTAEVVRLLRNSNVRGIVRRRPVLLRSLWAGLVLATFAGLAYFRPAVAETWARRLVLLEPIRYPRYTHLEIVGFEGTSKKVARGRDFELAVTADPQKTIPEKVEVRYWMPGSGGSGSQYLTKIGRNRFRFTFKGVLEPIQFEIRGGDDRTELHELIAVDPPMLEGIVLHTRYPEYTGVPERTMRYAGAAIEVVRGTTVDVELQANKPLRSLSVKSAEQSHAVERQSGRSFRARYLVEQDLPLEVSLEDEDGITSGEPFQVMIRMLEDQPPVVEARLRGISGAISPVAVIPIVLEVSDDFGVANLSIVAKVGEEAEATEPIPLRPLQRTLQTTFTYDVTKHQLEPGNRLSLAIIAEDGDTVSGPHVGRSVELSFEVVTEEELLSRLATREINLRQRFEQIVRELTESRARLIELEPSLLASPESEGENQSANRRESDLLGVERRLGEIRKSASESAGVHADFESIRDELVNNRAGTTLLLERIEKGIVEPMAGLVNEEFPAAEAALEQLRAGVGTGTPNVTSALPSAIDAEDRLLAKANAILEGMLKLESFNEALAMLRGIIAEQQALLEKTKEQRKQQVLDLLK